MIKLHIADDEENVREALKKMIALYMPGVQVVGVSDSVSATVDALNRAAPDILLLDVEMKEGTGFDVLRQFTQPKFKVIFVTAYQQYALQAFRFAALDYLLKPVDPDLLVAVLSKATDAIDREKLALRIDSFLFNMSSLSKGAKKVVLKTADNIHVVNLNEIVYCEADRSYTSFYLSDRTRIMVSNTLGNYEEMFEEYGFLRIHTSYLLNTHYIRRYEKGDGGTVILSNEVRLPVATRKKDQLLQLLARL